MLRGHHGLAIELARHRRLMALATVGDDRATIDRLVSARRRLAEDNAGNGKTVATSIPFGRELRTDSTMRPRDAFYASIGDAPGKIAAEMVCPYPPGIPIILPGERFMDAIVGYLKLVTAAGAMVEGVVDQSVSKVRVVDA